jgi:hypothetical protein
MKISTSTLDEKTRFEQLISDQCSRKVQYEQLSVDFTSSRRKVDIALGSRRSHDFDGEDQPGQDYAIVRADAGHVVAVVADGVSRSFYGDIAARQVSEMLIDFLWEARSNPPNAQSLESKLAELSKRVAHIVQRHKIPDSSPLLLRKALENKRAKGSQAVFTGAIVDGRRNEIHLYQVGNVDVIVHLRNGEETYACTADPNGRWSSAGRSELRLKVSSFQDACGMVIKSDGLGPGWGLDLMKDAFNEHAFHEVAETFAGKDDVSFIALYWGCSKEEKKKSPLKIMTRSILPVPYDLPYQISLQARGGQEPYAWSVAGSLPYGLTLKDGKISGRTRSTGFRSFIICLRDSQGETARAHVEMKVEPPTGSSPKKDAGTIGFPSKVVYILAGGFAFGIFFSTIVLLYLIQTGVLSTKKNTSSTGAVSSSSVPKLNFKTITEETTQSQFREKYADALGGWDISSIDTKTGQAIIHISIEGDGLLKADPSSVELAVEGKWQLALPFATNKPSGGKREFLALIGDPKGKPVDVVQVKVSNSKGEVIHDGEIKLRGRQAKLMKGDKTIFYGYQETKIVIAEPDHADDSKKE